jgi:hypothetical protein
LKRLDWGNIAHETGETFPQPSKVWFPLPLIFGPAGIASSVSLDCIHSISSRNEVGMEIDKDRITTQEETGEPAPIDQVEDRVEAEMKILEGEAKKQVADGLQDEKLAREAERLQKEGKQELEEATD